MSKKAPELRVVAWELTQACPLACDYCRAGSRKWRDKGELFFDECRRVVDDIVEFARPLIILSGGDPLTRGDVCNIAAYAARKNLRTVVATTGILVDDMMVKELGVSGVLRVSLGLESASEAKHDALRHGPGAFKAVVDAARHFRNNGMEFQINCTITTENADEAPAIIAKARELGAAAVHFFLIVPTGRAREGKKFALNSAKYDEVLRYLAGIKDSAGVEIRVTCAPHFQRIMAGKGAPPKTHELSGCLAGTSYAFISYNGAVKPCGYLDVVCGNVRDRSLKEIWEESEVFLKLRDRSGFSGKCGICEFRDICGGCRARALEINGSFTAEEPFCSYVPGGK